MAGIAIGVLRGKINSISPSGNCKLPEHEALEALHQTTNYSLMSFFSYLTYQGTGGDSLSLLTSYVF